MSRDKARYPDPEAFFPERFLNSDGTLKEDNPADFVFGFGRRVCPGRPQYIPAGMQVNDWFMPGRHSADASIWTSIVTMLATLDFNPPKDANGNDIEFEAKFMNGLTQ